jgi:hypothetical protein
MTTSFEQLGFVPEKKPSELKKFAKIGFKPTFRVGEKEKAEKVAKGLRFFGKEFTPEQIQKVREPIKQEAILPLIEFLTGRFGAPGDIAEGLQRLVGIEEPIKTFPTSELFKRDIESFAGEEFRPETSGQQQRADLASLFGALSLGGALGPAFVGAAAGTGVGGLAEKLGLGPIPSAIASGLATLLPGLAGPATLKKVPKKPAERAALKIAEREGIKVPRAALKEELPVSRLKQAKPTKLTKARKLKFEKSVERAKDRIIEGITPSAKTEKEAIALKEAASKLFQSAEARADLIKGPVPTSNLRNALNRSIVRLEKSPALATEEASSLNFLRKMEQGLEAKNTTSNLMALHRSLNKEINFIKPTAGDRALLDVKAALKRDIESVGKNNRQFSKAWKKANADFSQSQKFLQMREALSPAFSDKGMDFTKFENIFTNVKKEGELRKLFGKENYSRLKEISQISKKGAGAYKELAKDTRFFKLLERFAFFSAINAVTTGVILGKPGAIVAAVPIVALEKGGAALYRGYLGRLMTNNKFQRDHLNLLKALKSQNKRAVIATMKKVNDNMGTVKKDIED